VEDEGVTEEKEIRADLERFTIQIAMGVMLIVLAVEALECWRAAVMMRLECDGFSTCAW
jgi:hypothetical protein